MAGDGNRYGKTTGLSRGQFIVAIFDRQFQEKRSDEDIVEIIRAEFPCSDADYPRYIRMYRNKYNRGEFPCQATPPLVPIPRFEKNKPAPQKSGPSPRYSWEEPESRTTRDNNTDE